MEPMDPMDGVEQVLVVPRSELFGGKAVPEGYHEVGLDELLRRIAAYQVFVPRPEAEDDPSLKQIIPYSYLSWEGKVFLLRRLRKQTEARLHDKLSIGVGGHINPGEQGVGTIVERGALRELHEEIHVRTPYALRLKGFLNDDSNPVGRVHFGLIYEVVLAGGEIEVAEKDLMEGQFVTVSDLAAHRDGMETWSQILTDHLLGSMLPPRRLGGL